MNYINCTDLQVGAKIPSKVTMFAVGMWFGVGDGYGGVLIFYFRSVNFLRRRR